MTPEVLTQAEMITIIIDGFEVTAPKGTLVIRAAEKLGIQIPRFCDHPLFNASRSLPSMPSRY
jgi:NADH-quinone oxidoreductase subunit G